MLEDIWDMLIRLGWKVYGDAVETCWKHVGDVMIDLYVASCQVFGRTDACHTSYISISVEVLHEE